MELSGEKTKCQYTKVTFTHGKTTFKIVNSLSWLTLNRNHAGGDSCVFVMLSTLRTTQK